jgi:hypothetical protein
MAKCTFLLDQTLTTGEKRRIMKDNGADHLLKVSRFISLHSLSGQLLIPFHFTSHHVDLPLPIGIMSYMRSEAHHGRVPHMRCNSVPVPPWRQGRPCRKDLRVPRPMSLWD